MVNLVFVYGTLKSGEPNHGLLQPPANAKLIGDAITLQRYPLVIATRYNMPMALDSPGLGKNIQGEVYEVDQACLAKLDELEEHPEYYERTLIEVRLLDNKNQDQEGASSTALPGAILTCFMYRLGDFQERLLELPVHEAYSSAGNHGLPYRNHQNVELASSDYCSRKEVKKTL